MTSDRYSDEIAAARQNFEEGLIRAGFLEKEGAWIGEIDHGTTSTQVIVVLTQRFPFKPARVFPIEHDAVPWSWHRESDGSLCLVADDDHEGLWWSEAEAFLDKARRWFEGSANGWAGDRPDLDLDRYFQPSDSDKCLYLFGDLVPVTNLPVRFEVASNNVMRLTGPGRKPAKNAKTSKRKYGFVIDIGTMMAPPNSWADISALVDPQLKLDDQIRNWSVNVVVVRYRRESHEGAIVLKVWPNQADGISARRLLAGAETRASKTVRSGPSAPRVKSKRVAIIGVGALGSFLADGLVRGGIDDLTLIDGDRLMPGNLVRHLVGPEGVGLAKSTAVKQSLERRFPGFATVTAKEAHLYTADEAIGLLLGNDLVINATADFSVTALLNATAGALGKHALSVAIQNQGETFRIDVLPPLEGESAMVSSARENPEFEVPYYDSGCGSPISPTSPAVVIEASSAAVRHAVALLLSEPLSRSGETREVGHHRSAVDPTS